MDDLGELQRRYDNREAGHEHVEAEVNDDQGEDEQGDVADVTGLTQYQKNGRSWSGCCLAADERPGSGHTVFSGLSVTSQDETPRFATVDGHQLDLAALTLPCELSSLLVQVEAADDGQADGLDHEHGEHGPELDSLLGVISSTGFYLD